MAKTKLVICETSTSTGHYHLREVNIGEEKFSGGAGNSLCNKEMGWDTKLPISSYGLKGHLPEKYCKECMRLAKEKGLI